MLPSGNAAAPAAFRIVERSSRTYRIDAEGRRVSGQLDGLEAVRQAAFCILNTERYEHLIFSWNYGIELDDLYGRPVPFVKSELKRRIQEALTQDDRIRSVDAFTFEAAGKRLHVSFTVHSSAGSFDMEKGVEV